LAATLAAAVLLLALIPAGAGAVIVHLRSGRTLSFLPLRQHRALRPLDALFSNLDYNGGPVMPSNTNYMVYWRPSGAEKYPAGYQEGINRYFQDLAHDSGGTNNVDSVSAQYNDASGQFANYQSAFGEALVDEHAYPPSGCPRATTCLTDKQIQEELARFVKEKKLPIDLTHEYFLLTPPEVESCFEEEGFQCSAGTGEFAVYCAYHGNAEIEGKELIYANDPFVAGNFGCDEGISPNESPSDGELQGGLSHEHNESTTDPLPNTAWTDFGSSEPGEIGDKCSREPGSALGTTEAGEPYNQEINGHFYWYQEEWSNQGDRCLQRLSFAGERPEARFGMSPGAGDEVRVDATGSTAPGGVLSYNWQPDVHRFNPKPIETFTSAIGLIFSKAGTYTIGLTVFAHDGSSSGAACTVTVPITDEMPTATFAAPGEAVAAGATIGFDGSGSTDPDGTVKGYTWTFGDGTAAVNGATVSHQFSAPGTYPVKLTVTDSGCMAASVTHLVTVIAPPSAGGEGPGGGGGPTLPVTPPPPVEKPAPTGTVALLGSVLPVHAGRAAATISCAGTAPSCSGRLVLTLRVKVRVRGHLRIRTLTLASSAFTIPAGHSAQITLVLSRAARRRMRAGHGHLAIRLALVRTSPGPVLTQETGARLQRH
jgi:PKD repeat protein